MNELNFMCSITKISEKELLCQQFTKSPGSLVNSVTCREQCLIDHCPWQKFGNSKAPEHLASSRNSCPDCLLHDLLIVSTVTFTISKAVCAGDKQETHYFALCWLSRLQRPSVELVSDNIYYSIILSISMGGRQWELKTTTTYGSHR